MKQIHAPGDYAAPITFALAAIITFLRNINISADYALPGGNLLALVFLAIAVFLTIAAVRGRSIEDSATYYYCDGKKTSFLFVAFGTGFLLLGTYIPLFALQENSLKILIWALIMSLCSFLVTYFCILKLRIVVFNVDKTFLIMQGKPWSFTRHHKVSDFNNLMMGVEFSARYRSAGHEKHYCTYVINGAKKVLLLRDSSIEEARLTVKNITRLTGLELIGEEPK